MSEVYIRFDGPPGPVSGRFIEVERDGASISIGEWRDDGDDCLLVLTKYNQLEERNRKLEAVADAAKRVSTLIVIGYDELDRHIVLLQQALAALEDLTTPTK